MLGLRWNCVDVLAFVVQKPQQRQKMIIISHIARFIAESLKLLLYDSECFFVFICMSFVSLKTQIQYSVLY